MLNQSSNLKTLGKTLILVPQGSEYRAVAKNFQRNLDFLISPIPIGCSSVGMYLESITNPQQFGHAIVMGLCGSLSPNFKVGDVVVYAECIYLFSNLLNNQAKILPCTFIPQPYISKNISKVTQVKALTSDRLIHLAAEKQNLYKTTKADVVDMEGYVILEFFTKLNIPVGTIRVVSDDSLYDLPDLEKAIDRDGNLKPLQLAIAFAKQPLAAGRLIRGSLKSLQVLSKISIRSSM